MASDERRWVVQPDEVRIEIAIGSAVKVSPELREALDRLAQTLEQPEVQGHKMLYDTASAVIRKFEAETVGVDGDDVQGYMAEEEEEVQQFGVRFNCMGVW
jgi:hypothetical protein